VRSVEVSHEEAWRICPVQLKASVRHHGRQVGVKRRMKVDAAVGQARERHATVGGVG